MNAYEFNAEIRKWGKSLEPQYAVPFVKKIALDLLERVTKKSPVDTGRFRANWMVGIGGADGSVTESTEDAALQRGLAVLSGLNDLEKVHVSNNLSYAGSLEYGSSMQAPEGVLEVSVLEVRMAMQFGLEE